MGAWGYGIFENDIALDWVGDLEGADSAEFLQETFEAIPDDPQDFVESDESDSALAAGEVVAAILGRPLALGLPEDITTWIATHQPQASEKLVKEALRAVRRVAHQSESRDLWDDADLVDNWMTAVNDLIQRLTG